VPVAPSRIDAQRPEAVAVHPGRNSAGGIIVQPELTRDL
jgi:hypothetical protein